MPSTVAAVLLAAGASTRLGRPKQLVLFDGEPLLRRAARLALDAGAAPVYIIVPPTPEFDGPAPASLSSRPRSGPNSKPKPEYCSALDGLPVTLLPNPGAAEGMGSSLRIGIAALPLSIERVLVLVCDQPLLRPENLRALLAAPASVAAAQYGGRLGVPAVFSREHFAALAAVQGDQGARSLLRTLPVTPVPMPEAAIDIDTPADLLALQPGAQA